MAADIRKASYSVSNLLTTKSLGIGGEESSPNVKMKIKILKACVVNNGVAKVGSTVEVDVNDGNVLLKLGLAEETKKEPKKDRSVKTKELETRGD